MTAHDTTDCRGFTLIEVLMALAVCTMMVTVVGSALFTVMQQEQRASRRLRSALVMKTVECAHRLGEAGEELLETLDPTWSFLAHDQVEGDPPRRRRVYQFTPVDGRSVAWSLHFHHAPQQTIAVVAAASDFHRDYPLTICRLTASRGDDQRFRVPTLPLRFKGCEESSLSQ